MNDRLRYRSLTHVLLLLLLLLAACAPTVRYLPPETPIVYGVGYNALFDATLQELTAAYLPAATSRRTFSITEADRDTGLITAVRREPGTTANLRYRSQDRQDVGLGFGFNLLVPVPVAPTQETTITVVVRPEGEGASIIYSTQGPDGRSSADAETLMQRVITRLDARFGSEAGLVVRQRALP